MAKAGYLATDGKQQLIEKKGIEVGNIFQLGYHYSKLMKGAVYIDADGKEKPFYMGCYGFGVGRTMATIAEKYHDEKGLMWPKTVAPYDVHVVSLKDNEYAVKVAETLAGEGFEVLFDERDGASVGEKFADSELIGIPVQVIVSERGAKENIVEIRKREDLGNSQKINRDEKQILAVVNNILEDVE